MYLEQAFRTEATPMAAEGDVRGANMSAAKVNATAAFDSLQSSADKVRKGIGAVCTYDTAVYRLTEMTLYT